MSVLNKVQVFTGNNRSRHLACWASVQFAERDSAAVGCGDGIVKRMDLLDQRGLRPEFPEYIDLLRRCADARDLFQGKRLHAHIVNTGVDGDTILGNLLVRMYGKCGALDDAVAAFGAIRRQNVFSWSILIAAYAQNGHYREAVVLLRKMDLEGVKASHVTFVNLLGACCGLLDVLEGKKIHQRIVGSGIELKGNLGTALVNMYGKCGMLEDARAVFEGMPCKDVVAWNAMIAALAQHKQGEEALKLYYRVEAADDLKPDRLTYLSTLVACASHGSLEDGRKIHASLVSSGLTVDEQLGNTLVSMYGRCGSLEEAKLAFQGIPVKDSIAWSILIGACVQNGKSKEAVGLYRSMELEGIEPNENSLLNAVSACSSVEFLAAGKQLHARIAGGKLGSSFVLANALVTMYSKCGSLEDARRVFDGIACRTVVSWTSLIAAYVQHGLPEKALELYKRMESEGMKADEIAYISILEAVSSLDSIEEGQAVHAKYVASDLQSDMVETALVDMYGNCGFAEGARWVFDRMVFKNGVIPWTAMMTAYAHNGYGEEALLLFRKIDLEGIKPNQLTLVTALDACSSCEDIKEGRRIHTRVAAEGLESNVTPGTALVNMYDCCGELIDARAAFEGILSKNTISWNAMIGAYAHRGHRLEAVSLLHQMDQEGYSPNVVTFTCILFACSHAGMVSEARYQFHRMLGDYGIVPVEDNYGCMVDLLGRAGHLDKVEDLIRNMPLQPASPVWISMLGACKLHCDVDRGVRAAENVREIDPDRASAYVVLSNIYAELGRHDDAALLKHMHVALRRGARWQSKRYIEEQKNQSCLQKGRLV